VVSHPYFIGSWPKSSSCSRDILVTDKHRNIHINTGEIIIPTLRQVIIGGRAETIHPCIDTYQYKGSMIHIGTNANVYWVSLLNIFQVREWKSDYFNRSFGHFSDLHTKTFRQNCQCKVKFCHLQVIHYIQVSNSTFLLNKNKKATKEVVFDVTFDFKQIWRNLSCDFTFWKTYHIAYRMASYVWFCGSYCSFLYHFSPNWWTTYKTDNIQKDYYQI